MLIQQETVKFGPQKQQNTKTKRGQKVYLTLLFFPLLLHLQLPYLYITHTHTPLSSCIQQFLCCLISISSSTLSLPSSS